MKRPYRSVRIDLTRWQWQVLRASARAWGDRDVEAHLQQLVIEHLEQIAAQPEDQFEEPFPIPRTPVTWWRETRCRVVGTRGLVDVGWWHPKRSRCDRGR